MPNNLKLCYVADATNIHVQRWLRYFLDQGHQVYCLTDKHDKGRMEHIAGATVIDIPNRETLLAEGKRASKRDVLKARTYAIKHWARELKPDVMHAIFLYQRGWSAACARIHPLVITLLGSDLYLPRKQYATKSELRRDERMNALALKQADLITGVSEDLVRVASRLTRDKNQVEMLPIGIDPDMFRADIETFELREKLNIDEDAYVVLSPRQITPLYNQETIIQSIPKILSEIPNAVFILKDTQCNTDERRNYVKRLNSLATSLNIRHAIRWAEEVELEDLPLFYNLADVIVSMPSTDGLPVTIFEAMACRKPLIVGDLPSYDGVIVNGQTGLRVPLRNHQALAQAIIKIHNNKELVDRMVEESQLILQEYGIFNQQMQRMERYYHALKHHRIERPKSLSASLDTLNLDLMMNFG